MKKPMLILTAAGALALVPALARATVQTETQVAYSTLTPAGDYQADYGYTIGGGQAFADQFIPVAGGTLSSIEIGLRYVNSPEPALVHLRPDNGFGLPSGTVLASGTVMVTTAFGTFDTTSLATFQPQSPVELNTSTAYWLAVLPVSGSTFLSWNDSVGTYGTTASTHSGESGWGMTFPHPSLQQAFRVNVVPEPSVLLMLGWAGFCLMGRWLRRARPETR